MEIGIDSFASAMYGTHNTLSSVDAMEQLLDRIELADQVGLDVFGIGEHHKKEFLDSATAIILSAASARTKRIHLTSAVTVLSAAVRVYQNFATLDLISKGRAEIVVGRGSSIEAYPLFRFELKDYDQLFKEKLGLLLKIRDNEFVTWSGRYRPALNNLPVYPRTVVTNNVGP
ncbi:LLM class flavin-dependent oxidoreductase [Mucilaginibacter paludis]|uniref:Luciferase-like, subgroup n=1 Tax=Mucilaginibacter paludis DSM 18603 TaxID=714943 RepID=H1Y9A1_9SPHI|nr:LLM class flavin-dependent oxidoreductase [Mucilaginibacter paludis]EHQ29479.1 Luciferase-like, subgroup [Mucilaginibacter paludis DSM 18603]